jgi:hypothetical protein
LTSSIYPRPIVIAGTPIPASSDILTNNIDITNDMVKPGGGGILRIYFSFTFTTSPATVAVLNNGNLKGNLNADNTSQVVTDGIYRFDIDVEAGDAVNLQCTDIITGVNYVRAHLVQFGA